MTDREAMIAAIAASPADDLPRLVFADWLEDNGDPAQAEFIRAHVRLYRMRPGTGEHAAIAKRCDELMRANCGVWLKTACDAFGCEPPRFAPTRRSSWIAWGSDSSRLRLRTKSGEPSVLHTDLNTYRVEYQSVESNLPVGTARVRRGLVDHLAINLSQEAWKPDATLIATLFRTAPISNVSLTIPDCPMNWEAIEGPHLAPVRFLSICQPFTPRIPPEGLNRAILNSPHLTGVSTLTVAPDYPAEVMMYRSTGMSSSWEILSPSPLLSRIRVLRVSYSDPTFAALSGVASLPLLEELSPNPGLPITPNWSLLPSIPLRETLRRLSLKSCRLTDDAMLAITRVRRWDKLTHLRLDQNQIADRGVAGMCRTCVFPEVRFLNLSDNQIGDLGAVAIARSGLAQTVRFLDLTKNRLTATGAIPLAAALAEGPLELLKLTARPLGRRTVRRVSEMLGRRVRFE